MKFGVAVLLVCVHAFAGGVVGGWYFAPSENANPTFETVTVTDGLWVAKSRESAAGCRLGSDGTVTASQGMLANQIRASVIGAQSILASSNPLSASFDDQQILAQMTADPQAGGKIIALSPDAALVPAAGAPKKGMAACIRFHPQSGQPELFTHDLARGESGKSYMVAYKPGSGGRASAKGTVQK